MSSQAEKEAEKDRKVKGLAGKQIRGAFVDTGGARLVILLTDGTNITAAAHSGPGPHYEWDSHTIIEIDNTTIIDK